MTYIKCRIRKGSWLFTSERFVEIDTGQTIYKTIADEASVQEYGKLTDDNSVEGLLRVYRVEMRGENALVILPREAMGNGRRVLVPQSLLQHVQ